MTVPTELTDAQWTEFRKNGYVNLGKVLSDDDLEGLRSRLDAIMMGDIKYEKLMYQLDPGGKYSNTEQNGQTLGWKGATKEYRKIGEAGCGLECDELFLKFMTSPLMVSICAEVYGPHTPIAPYRAMMMNKPANSGTDLPWHQDGGEFWGVDRDPQSFVWLALDDSTTQNGCVKVVKGTHKLGLLTKRGHTLTEEDIAKIVVPDLVEHVELKAGEAVLCHNYLVHSSSTNVTDKPRRGFSVNYMDARSKVTKPGPECPMNCEITAGKPFAKCIIPGTLGKDENSEPVV
eukprot:TRINITY_DN4144_c0_g1_i1.p1 TRINITY_DN4144_c0_g1~~TRINITY_DN4144_c0_g1_i1.p1  ORF type:complete len:288 (+),score=54.63 TRINITY_DN4144_c0_g1_i1:117-980(+)